MTYLIYGLAFGLAWTGAALVREAYKLRGSRPLECHPGVAAILGGLALVCGGLLPWCVA